MRASRSNQAGSSKAKSKFSIRNIDPFLLELANQTDHRTLGVWARECAERVLPYFEKNLPKDLRPRRALDVLKAWTETGVFAMAAIRGASLAAHAAARDADEASPARSAARTAGQAVATAHVPIHSVGAAIYALQAVHRAADPSKSATAAAKELDWQIRRLASLRKKSGPAADPRRLFRARPSSGGR